jgi:hypothetical protein
MSRIKAEWIEGLGSRYPEERAKAAAEVHALGRDRAAMATQAWWRNADMARLCGPSPAATVGLAVQPPTFAKIREANDFPRLAEVPPEQDASEFELHFPGGVALDVLTTSEPKGTGIIARFLARQGQGVQQVEFRCADVNRATEILRDQFGVQPVYPAKRPGAEGSNVNFFLVTVPDGTKVLIELYEQGPLAG